MAVAKIAKMLNINEDREIISLDQYWEYIE